MQSFESKGYGRVLLKSGCSWSLPKPPKDKTVVWGTVALSFIDELLTGMKTLPK